MLSNYAGKKPGYPSKKTKLSGLIPEYLWLKQELGNDSEPRSIRGIENLKVKSQEGQEKKLKAALSGARHLILRERELSLALTLHIIRVCERRQVFCWQWTPPTEDAPHAQRFGQLIPLFTTGYAESALRD